MDVKTASFLPNELSPNKIIGLENTERVEPIVNVPVFLSTNQNQNQKKKHNCDFISTGNVVWCVREMANQGAKKRKEENSRHITKLRHIIIACNVLFISLSDFNFKSLC